MVAKKAKEKKDPIVQEGHAVLRERALPVHKKDFGSLKLKNLIQKMSKVLAHEQFGVAIAAPQVGESLRLFVVSGRSFEQEPKKNASEKVLGSPVQAAGRPGRPDSFLQHSSSVPDVVFINPEIIRLSRKKKEMSEGCLSVRGKYGTVLRHEKASVKAFDVDGKPFTYHATGLVAHIFQHECDHLDGVLYTDKAIRMRDEQDELEEK